MDLRLMHKFALVTGGLGTPEEVANVITFLCCSGRESLVNGACVVTDGGESISF